MSKTKAGPIRENLDRRDAPAQISRIGKNRQIDRLSEDRAIGRAHDSNDGRNIGYYPKNRDIYRRGYGGITMIIRGDGRQGIGPGRRIGPV